MFLTLAAKVTAALADWLSGYHGAPVWLKPNLDQVPALAAERDAQVGPRRQCRLPHHR